MIIEKNIKSSRTQSSIDTCVLAFLNIGIAEKGKGGCNFKRQPP